MQQDVNHYRCDPAKHDRDGAGAIENGQEHDGQGHLLCNDCRSPIFWCGNTGNYHHLGDVPACWLINEGSWPLRTAGFSTEDGGREPFAPYEPDPDCPAGAPHCCGGDHSLCGDCDREPCPVHGPMGGLALPDGLRLA